MLNQVRELKLKNERLENSNRQLEERIKKLQAEKAERKPEFKGDLELKKENESLKEEIKKALQIHTANLKLKEKNEKLEEQMKQAQLASQSTLRDQLKASIDQETAQHREVVSGLER